MFNNEGAFTLIEMLVVLLIIAVLILLIVPTIGNRSKNVNNQGCEALVLTVQAQADAYRLEKGSYPSSLEQLKAADFITDKQMSCKNNQKLTIDSNGVVKVTDG